MVSLQNLKTFAIEFVCYAPLVVVAAYRFRNRSADALAPS